MDSESLWARILDRFLRRGPELGAQDRQRVGNWMRRSPQRVSTALAKARFVVLDTETSGLDVRRDRLLSIGACIVSEGKLSVAQHFYREIRQEQSSSTDNILLHGIGGSAQRAGEPEAEVLASFLEFAGKHALVAFNAPFDEQFLARAMHRHLGVRFALPWIDLAQLPKAMYPADAQERLTLDDWLARFSIVHLERHNALADAFCTAQLLLVMLDKAKREGYSNVRGLLRAQRNYQWQRHRTV